MFLEDYIEKKPAKDGGANGIRRLERTTGGAAVGMDGSVSFYSSAPSENVSNFSDDAGESLEKVEVTYSGKPAQSKKRRLMIITSSALLIAATFFCVVFFTTEKVQTNKAASSVSVQPCQLGVVKDVREPQLEIYITGLSRMPTGSEKQELEQAVAAGYNKMSGGCSDRYERWMYNVTLLDETAIHNVVMTKKNTRLENIFEDVSTLKVTFQTKISCNGCTPEEAFASVYPPLIESTMASSSVSETNEDDTGYRRGRRMSESSYLPLNAADIIRAIENEAHRVMPNFKDFLEVTILVQGEDGSSVAKTLLREEENQKNEAYKPAFFRKKEIEDVQRYYECHDGQLKKRKKGKSGSYSRSSKSSDSYSRSSKSSKSSKSSGSYSISDDYRPSPTKRPAPAPTAAPTKRPVSSPTRSPTNVDNSFDDADYDSGKKSGNSSKKSDKKSSSSDSTGKKNSGGGGDDDDDYGSIGKKESSDYDDDEYGNSGKKGSSDDDDDYGKKSDGDYDDDDDDYDDGCGSYSNDYSSSGKKGGDDDGMSYDDGPSDSYDSSYDDRPSGGYDSSYNERPYGKKGGGAFYGSSSGKKGGDDDDYGSSFGKKVGDDDDYSESSYDGDDYSDGYPSESSLGKKGGDDDDYSESSYDGDDYSDGYTSESSLGKKGGDDDDYNDPPSGSSGKKGGYDDDYNDSSYDDAYDSGSGSYHGGGGKKGFGHHFAKKGGDDDDEYGYGYGEYGYDFGFGKKGGSSSGKKGGDDDDYNDPSGDSSYDSSPSGSTSGKKGGGDDDDDSPKVCTKLEYLIEECAAYDCCEFCEAESCRFTWDEYLDEATCKKKLCPDCGYKKCPDARPPPATPYPTPPPVTTPTPAPVATPPPTIKRCEFDFECIGVGTNAGGCPLCVDGECMEGCRNNVNPFSSSAAACCKLAGRSGNFVCSSSCGNNVCLQNPVFDWEGATNQQEVCQTNDQATVCNEDCPEGCTSPEGTTPGDAFATYSELDMCINAFTPMDILDPCENLEVLIEECGAFDCCDFCESPECLANWPGPEDFSASQSSCKTDICASCGLGNCNSDGAIGGDIVGV